MSPHQVTNLANLLSYDNNITHLNLANTGINAETLTILETALTSNSNHITSLDLTSLSKSIKENELKILVNILSHPCCHISHLSLRLNDMQGSKMGILRDFFANPNNTYRLTDIDLRSTKLTLQEVEMLIDILTDSHNIITHLDLRNNSLSLESIKGLVIALENKNIKIDIDSDININDYARIIQGNPNMIMENKIVVPLYQALIKCENEYDRSQAIINFSKIYPDSIAIHIAALLNNDEYFKFNIHEVDENGHSLLYYQHNQNVRDLLITHGAEISDIEDYESDSEANEDAESSYWDHI